METYLPTLTVAGVLGFIAPLASTAITKLAWSGRVKQIVAAIVSIVAAVLAMLVTSTIRPPLPTDDLVVYWLTTALSVIAVSQLAYSLLWKPTGVDAKLAAATASKAEKAEFIARNTVPANSIVDSTDSQTAAAVIEEDQTPVDPNYIPRH